MENNELSGEIQEKLAVVLRLLGDNEKVLAFKKVDQQIKDHERIQFLIEEIKRMQKEAVAFQHYGQREAAIQANQQVDALTAEFDSHPLVLRYRELLKEVSELLQFVTKEIEEEVNRQIIENPQEQDFFE